ncbi:hypothetical protein L484_022070 [Morus notabilis]|uniref:Uncharacterized protein n=1 Tax=Morus notabilis TaxID=981085 RepID=W9S028_9ROSA|nr:hypothetical protein L484_022070 [Morus notabilis]
MEKAKQFLELTEEESEIISRLAIPTHRPGSGSCFYEDFALKGIRVDRVEAGLVVCTFKVPPRLTDRDGKLATGAIANLVDEVGSVLVHVESPSMNVSVDMSISFLSTAEVDGQKIEENEHAEILLRSLPDSYDQFIINIANSNIVESLRFEDVVGAVLDEESQCKNKEDMLRNCKVKKSGEKNSQGNVASTSNDGDVLYNEVTTIAEGR